MNFIRTLFRIGSGWPCASIFRRRVTARRSPAAATRSRLALAAAFAFICVHLCPSVASGAFIRTGWTNVWTGLPLTNSFILIHVGDIRADGGATPQGLPIRVTPSPNGLQTNQLPAGNYYATNANSAQAVYFRVPDDSGPTVYSFTQPGVWISGGNYFVTLVITNGGAGSITRDAVTNALGGAPILGTTATNSFDPTNSASAVATALIASNTLILATATSLTTAERNALIATNALLLSDLAAGTNAAIAGAQVTLILSNALQLATATNLSTAERAALIATNALLITAITAERNALIASNNLQIANTMTASNAIYRAGTNSPSTQSAFNATNGMQNGAFTDTNTFKVTMTNIANGVSGSGNFIANSAGRGTNNTLLNVNLTNTTIFQRTSGLSDSYDLWVGSVSPTTSSSGGPNYTFKFLPKNRDADEIGIFITNDFGNHWQSGMEMDQLWAKGLFVNGVLLTNVNTSPAFDAAVLQSGNATNLNAYGSLYFDKADPNYLYLITYNSPVGLNLGWPPLRLAVATTNGSQMKIYPGFSDYGQTFEVSNVWAKAFYIDGVPIVTTASTNGYTTLPYTNVNAVVYQSGSITNPTLIQTTSLGGNTNWMAQGPSIVGLGGSTLKEANTTFRQTGPTIWTNDQKYANGYDSSIVTNGSLSTLVINGSNVATAPINSGPWTALSQFSGETMPKWTGGASNQMTGIVILGQVDSTNLFNQMTNAAANAAAGATNSFGRTVAVTMTNSANGVAGFATMNLPAKFAGVTIFTNASGTVIYSNTAAQTRIVSGGSAHPLIISGGDLTYDTDTQIGGILNAKQIRFGNDPLGSEVIGDMYEFVDTAGAAGPINDHYAAFLGNSSANAGMLLDQTDGSANTGCVIFRLWVGNDGDGDPQFNYVTIATNGTLVGAKILPSSITGQIPLSIANTILTNTGAGASNLSYTIGANGTNFSRAVIGLNATNNDTALSNNLTAAFSAAIGAITSNITANNVTTNFNDAGRSMISMDATRIQLVATNGVPWSLVYYRIGKFWTNSGSGYGIFTNGNGITPQWNLRDSSGNTLSFKSASGSPQGRWTGNFVLTNAPFGDWGRVSDFGAGGNAEAWALTNLFWDGTQPINVSTINVSTIQSMNYSINPDGSFSLGQGTIFGDNGGNFSVSGGVSLGVTSVDGLTITDGNIGSGDGSGFTNVLRDTITRTNFLLATDFTNTTTGSIFVKVEARCNPTTTGNALGRLLIDPSASGVFSITNQFGLEADAIFTTAPHKWDNTTAILKAGAHYRIVDVTGEGLFTITNSYWEKLDGN